MSSLLFALLDEFLYRFSTDEMLCKDVRIVSFNREAWTITARGYDRWGSTRAGTDTHGCSYGERFSLAKHPQGTEVKAITYSNMQARAGPCILKAPRASERACPSDPGARKPSARPAEGGRVRHHRHLTKSGRPQRHVQ